MKQPVQMLLEVLLDGQSVFHDGHEYVMADDGSLCVAMKKDSGEEVYCNTFCELSGFKALADSIGRDELWLRLCQCNSRG